MRDKRSLWEQAFPPDDSPHGWRRWIALDPQHRTDARYWRKVRKRLARAGITVEAASDDEVRTAIAETDGFTEAAQSDRAAERSFLAVKLRDEGMTFRQIGVVLGVCVERARTIHWTGLRRLRRPLP
jgi:hypothetical protein